MKKILILLAILFTSNVFAEDIRLSCVVNGMAKATFFGKTEKKDDIAIKNQKVDVLLSIKDSDLFIRVDGVDRYTTNVVSTYTNENTKIKDKIIENYSDGNIYHLKNTATIVEDLPITITSDIKIDRVLGKLTVNYKLDAIRMYDLTTTYSGNCSKVNNVNKF